MAKDSSGQGRDAQVLGAGRVKQGGGQALRLSGNGEAVMYKRDPKLGIQGPVTVEAWIKPTADAEGLTQLMGESLNSILITMHSKDQLSWHVGAGNNRVSAALTKGAWNHVVATFDGKTISLYLNGESAGSEPSTKTGSNPVQAFVIGNTNASRPQFQGLVDHVRLYSRAISPEEVNAHFAAESEKYDHAEADSEPTGSKPASKKKPAAERAASPIDLAASTRFFETHPNAIDAVQQDDSVLFANREVGLIFRQSETGFELARLYGIDAGQDFLVPADPKEPSNLFEITMVTDPKLTPYRDESGIDFNVKITHVINNIAEIGDAFTVGSQSAKSVSWELEEGEGQSTLHLTWSGIDLKQEAGVMTVRVSITLKEGDPLARWRINITNPSEKYGIHRARLPILHLAPIGDRADNAMIYPKWRGGFMENPFDAKRGMGENYHTTGAYYPYYVSMQFWALYNQQSKQGVYVGTHDPEANMTHFSVDNTPEQITWSVTHFPPSIGFAALDFNVPYDSVTGPFAGDWYDACQVYRNWAIDQPWARKGPLASRDDVPIWYKESPLFLYTVLGDAARGTNSEAENIKLAEDDFMRWLEWAGVRLPLNYYLWQDAEAVGMSALQRPDAPSRPLESDSHRRRWAGFTSRITSYAGNYPAIGALDGFAESSARIRKAGGMVNPYVCMQLYDQGPLNNTAYVDEARLAVGRGSHGRRHTWPGLHLWFMCVAHPWWQDRLVEETRMLMERENAGGIYLDVMHGMGIPCLWTPHGHPHGGGTTMTGGMHQLADRIRNAVKEVDPEAITTGENSTENMIDAIDGVLYQRTLRPENQYPLFATVYQDYIPRYGIEMSIGRGDDFYIEAASLFVEGAQIGRMRIRPRGGSLDFDDPKHQPMFDFLETVVDYYKQDTAKQFLAYGQLLRPLSFDAPTTMPMLGYDDGNSEALTDIGVALGNEGTIYYSALTSGVFRSPDGELGVFLVNASDQPIAYKASLDPVAYGLPANTSMAMTEIDADGKGRDAAGGSGEATIEGELPAHGITMYRLVPRSQN